MSSLPQLEDLRELGGARVLARLDLNVPLTGGVVQDAARIAAAVPTLRWLLERGAVVAACSHLGRPKGRPDPGSSLQPVADALSLAMGRTVAFVADCIGSDVETALAGAVPGDLVVLENLRFHAGEKANDDAFAEALAAPFSHYVNDAFGTAHRAHASVAAVPTLFVRGRRAAGRLMAAELSALRRLVDAPEHPFVAVVGGAKISGKTEPLAALVERVDTLLLGGGMANTFLLAEGWTVGRSLVEETLKATASEVMERAAARGVRVLLPEDVVVTDDLAHPSEVAVVGSHAVPEDSMIVDIGPVTRERYAVELGGAHTAFWNGPMGVFEREAFAAGTVAVAAAMAACAGFTVVGGGESVMAVHRAGVVARIDHVSTGGGASLDVVAGKELPAVAALEA